MPIDLKGVRLCWFLYLSRKASEDERFLTNSRHFFYDKDTTTSSAFLLYGRQSSTVTHYHL